jgi:hypothetical protein
MDVTKPYELIGFGAMNVTKGRPPTFSDGDSRREFGLVVVWPLDGWWITDPGGLCRNKKKKTKGGGRLDPQSPGFRVQLLKRLGLLPEALLFTGAARWCYELIRFGAMDVTKPYELIGFGAMDVTKPYELIGFGAMDVTKPYEFIGFGTILVKGEAWGGLVASRKL